MGARLSELIANGELTTAELESIRRIIGNDSPKQLAPEDRLIAPRPPLEPLAELSAFMQESQPRVARAEGLDLQAQRLLSTVRVTVEGSHGHGGAATPSLIHIPYLVIENDPIAELFATRPSETLTRFP